MTDRELGNKGLRTFISHISDNTPFQQNLPQLFYFYNSWTTNPQTTPPTVSYQNATLLTTLEQPIPKRFLQPFFDLGPWLKYVSPCFSSFKVWYLELFFVNTPWPTNTDGSSNFRMPNFFSINDFSLSITLMIPLPIVWYHNFFTVNEPLTEQHTDE